LGRDNSSFKGITEETRFGDDLFSQLAVAVKAAGFEYSSESQFEFYDLFLKKLQALCSDSPKTTNELVNALELSKTQLNRLLKQAVTDKKLEKLAKPVRYQWLTTQQGALPF